MYVIQIGLVIYVESMWVTAHHLANSVLTLQLARNVFIMQMRISLVFVNVILDGQVWLAIYIMAPAC